MSKLRFLGLVAGLWMLVCCSAAWAAGPQSYHFGDRRYSPEVAVKDGRTFFSFADPQVQSLVEATASRLVWSSSRKTLIVYSPMQESVISAGDANMDVNKHKQPAPGLMLNDGERTLIEPSLLFYALGLQERPKQPGYLAASIECPKVVQTGDGRCLEIRLPSHVKWTADELDDNKIVLTFADCVWSGSENSFVVDDVNVAVQAQRDVKLTMTSPANWKLWAHKSLDASSCKIAISPNFPGATSSTAFENASCNKVDSFAEVAFQAQAPYQYFWRFDDTSRRLVIDFPQVTGKQPSSLAEVPGFMSGATLRSVGNGTQPVWRFEATLEPGCAFDFPSDKQEFGKLVLRVGSSLASCAISGQACTVGYVVSRGVIVIDPGHGGGDSGCVNHSLGLREKDVTLDVALRLKEVLEEQGWTVVLTRETDRDVSYLGSPDRVELQSRVDVANDIDADYFVSLHCNASVSSAPAGSSVYWYKSEDYELAASLEYALGESLGLEQDGLIREGFYVLRHTEMPSILVEMAFLTNYREGSLLGQSGFRQRIADNLAGALANHITGVYASGRSTVKSAP